MSEFILLKRPPIVVEYPDDVEKMRSILRARGYDATLSDIQWAWRSESDDACAGWLTLSGFEDGEIFDALINKLS